MEITLAANLINLFYCSLSIFRRELTAIELANDDNHLEEIGLCGSNSQLNTGSVHYFHL